MSVALDLDSLLVPQPMPQLLTPSAPVRRSLHVVGCEPAPDRSIPARAQAERALAVSVLHAPSPASIAPSLRLTRRGVAVLAALTAVVGALLVWAAALSAPDAVASGSVAAVPATVTVHPGDTLWELATRLAPDRDPRAEVAELRRLNHLAAPDLLPGQVLRAR